MSSRPSSNERNGHSFGRSFSDNRHWVFVGAQPNELDVPNVIRVGPLEELKICDEFRLHPDALFHFRGSEALAPSTGRCFREIDEWAGLHDEWLQFLVELSARRRHKTGSDARR